MYSNDEYITRCRGMRGTSTEILRSAGTARRSGRFIFDTSQPDVDAAQLSRQEKTRQELRVSGKRASRYHHRQQHGYLFLQQDTTQKRSSFTNTQLPIMRKRTSMLRQTLLNSSSPTTASSSKRCLFTGCCGQGNTKKVCIPEYKKSL